MLKPGSHVAAIVTPVDEAQAQAQARAITAEFVVLATKQATLSGLAELAARSMLRFEIAGKFTLDRAPGTFEAYVAGALPGKHVMHGEAT
jgi:hypothetical protein